MAKVIGLIYDWDENWVGGSYYIENLILALGALPGQQPALKIYTKKKGNF